MSRRQVNADVVDQVQLSDGKIVRFGGSTQSVGRFISTKAVGSDERHDITHQYKYPEGTHTPNTCVPRRLNILINGDGGADPHVTQGSTEERQVYEKAQHRNKLQQRGEEPGLHLKVSAAMGM